MLCFSYLQAWMVGQLMDAAAAGLQDRAPGGPHMQGSAPRGPTMVEEGSWLHAVLRKV